MERAIGNWIGAFVISAALGLTLTATPAAASDEHRTATAQGENGFYCVQLDADAAERSETLKRISARLQHAASAGPVQVVVLVHGFQTPTANADQDYTDISSRIIKQTRACGLQPFIVGVHWDSGSASLGKWLPKAVGSRVTSLLGFKKAVKNPYLEKVKLAREVGREGLRTVLFHLQDAAPGVPVNVMAHSLGAEVVVAALAPEASVTATEHTIAERGRALKLGMVTLLGADLDHDAFSRERNDNVERALSQAQVWWVTVPEKNHADGMLELRRGAGRGDAVGNRGLELSRQDVDRILRRRGLVLDMGDIPVKHRFTDYVTEKRMDAVVRSLCYLADPTSHHGKTSTLATLDRILQQDPSQLRLAATDPCSVRLYAAWRKNSAAAEFPAIAVTDSIEPPVSVNGSPRMMQVSR